MATSREPIGVTGEVTWRVPSLSLADEAIELFTERARRARPGFSVPDGQTVAEIAGVSTGAVGDRTRRGAGAVVDAHRHPRRAARPLPAADWRCTTCGAPPTTLRGSLTGRMRC